MNFLKHFTFEEKDHEKEMRELSKLIKEKLLNELATEILGKIMHSITVFYDDEIDKLVLAHEISKEIEKITIEKIKEEARLGHI